MKANRWMLVLCVVMNCVQGIAQQEKRDVKTTFQTSGPWKPVTDVRADAVMVYGANDQRRMTFEERLQSWRDRGYTTHFMTGIAWGEYQDYFTGKYDGKSHLDEGQKAMQGDTIWHGHLVPYIVPTENYLKYFKERHIKRVIDAGVEAIFLEEPEFWARAGYSEAFKHEWKAYYGFDWRPQHVSAENTYLSNKLKYHLYYRALNEAFSYAKRYGKSKGMDVKCYVPTHSLVNYAQWQIVSPEASLASLPAVDGYIAQVWTGTSREPNYFDGKYKERVFETAFLEYGCMESMTAPTRRKVFFLTDPIEDRQRDWKDYRQNYQATFMAQLLYPNNNNFEMMPWPDRIYEGLYNESATSKKKIHIPDFYSTQMQVMVNTLNDMPLSANRVSGSAGISVMMANSLMFQRSPQPVEGYDDPQLSNFYGLTLPLLKRGVPVQIVHLENVGYEEALENTKVLLMSYSNMKPLDPKAHESIAQWVRKGGKLVYSARDNDPFQTVQEWWNKGQHHYAAPSEHLFELMGMPKVAAEGEYAVGRGKVIVLRHDPKEYVMQAGGDAALLKGVAKLYGKMTFKNHFTLLRGAYELVAVLDEGVVSSTPSVAKGTLIDLFDPELRVLKAKKVRPGRQAFLLNVNRVANKQLAQVLAAASRQYDEERTADSYSFVSKSPLGTKNVMRVLLPRQPRQVQVHDAAQKSMPFISSWDKKSHTLLLKFVNHPDGVKTVISW